MTLRKAFYAIKPIIPRGLQLTMRRKYVALQKQRYGHIWPIDPRAGVAPEDWQGWPEGKRFAVVLTHDVEWAEGQDKSPLLMNLEQERGFRSSFNFVPERYEVSAEIRKRLTQNGFEVGVHGLRHDGKLFRSRMEFERRAIRINQYIQAWDAVGFRAPAMHHNLDWLHRLDILYDASTFDVDPFEPQADGVGTIFPFWVPNQSDDGGYVELPYTVAQDFTPFVLMQEKKIDFWKKKVDWIVEKGGMVLVNTHPDYMNFGDAPLGAEQFPVERYLELLDYIQSEYAGEFWHALPKDVAVFIKKQHVEDDHHASTSEFRIDSSKFELPESDQNSGSVTKDSDATLKNKSRHKTLHHVSKHDETITC